MKNWAPKLLFAAAGISTVSSALMAQSPRLPAFEVASIRPGDPQPRSAGLEFLPGGRMVARNWPLGLLIQEVYKIGAFQIVGLDRWISGWSNTRYDIQARGGSAASEDQLKLMAQTLLAERFHLKFHREMKELPVYALIPAKGGLKLQVAKDDGRPRGTGGISSTAPMGRLFGNNVSMAHFVQILSEQQLDRPVVDRTNFVEPFDFRLEYAPPDRPDAVGPSIFVAIQEQLGLKLDPVRASIEVMVIDHIEKPSDN